MFAENARQIRWIMRIWSLGLIAYSAGNVLAEVAIDSVPSSLHVQANSYQASIEPDGCLTSLLVNGKDFLASGVAISRGSYFYSNGVLKLSEPQQAGHSSISATSDTAAITWQFAEDLVTWELANHSDQPMVFFLVLSAELEAVEPSGSAFMKPAVEQNCNAAVFVIADTAVRLQGFDRLWGPWQGPHQIVEVALPAKSQKRLELELTPLTSDQKQSLAKLNSPSAEPDFLLRSPRELQVIQRQSEAAGTVLLSGKAPPKTTRVKFRILGHSDFGDISPDWLGVTFSPGGAFTEELELPAGGWYQLEVQSLNGDQLLGELRVEKFGVGEVFVGAGQSNSTNCGQFKTQQTSGMVSSFGGSEWQLADDPQPGVADRSTGGSFWPAFGDAMYEQYRVPIGVATTGFGGTSVNQWQPEGDLFNWTSRRVEQLGQQGFRALLWHQGESDVEMAEEEYYSKLRNLIQNMRKQAGWEFPWFVAQASYHNPERNHFPEVRAAQARLWKERIAYEGPDTDTLGGDNRDFDGAGIHFSPQGLKAHGELWAEKVGNYLDEVFSKDASLDAATDR